MATVLATASTTCAATTTASPSVTRGGVATASGVSVTRSNQSARLSWVDGFEVAGDAVSVQRRYGTGESPTFVTGRRGVGSALQWADDTATLVLSPAFNPALRAAVITAGLGLYVDDAASARLMFIRDGGTEQCALWLIRDSATEVHLEMRRGATVLGTGDALPAEQWFFIELKVRIHDTAGRFEVRVDQVPYLEEDAVDTKAASTRTASEIEIHLDVESGGEARVDDLYILAGDEWDMTPFWGDVATQALRPTSDATVTEWSPSAGSDHAALIDDVAADDDATYVEGPLGTEITDRFVYSDLGDDVVNGRLRGVMMSHVARTDDATAQDMRALLHDIDHDEGVLGRDDVNLTATDYADLVAGFDRNVVGLPFERQDASNYEFGLRTR